MSEIRRCPRCGDVMQVCYRQMPKSDAYAWVWFCVSCRHAERVQSQD